MLCSISCVVEPIDPPIDDPMDDDPIMETNVADTLDLVYGSHPLQNMRLYLPDGHNETTKTVVMVHGGGWVMGYAPDGLVTTFQGRFGWDLQTPLLEEGYALAVMKYRTACYNTVPSEFTGETYYNIDRMIEDINLVIQYLKDNSTTLEIADNHFQLVGESGGSHIVTYYGIKNTADPDVKSIVSMFAPLDLDRIEWKEYIAAFPTVFVAGPRDHFLKRSNGCTSVTNQNVKTFFSLKSFVNEDLDPQASSEGLKSLSPTIGTNIEKKTPTFIMNGDRDWLVPKYHATEMMSAFETVYGETSCGDTDFDCDYKLKIYEDCGHGWSNCQVDTWTNTEENNCDDIGGPCDRDEIMNDIVEWINAH